jgi:hypothetical protein
LDVYGTYTFPEAIFGYTPRTPQSITIANVGNQPTGYLTVTLDGVNSGSFTVTQPNPSSIPVGGTATFIVVPNAGLVPGFYSATVTVSGGNGIWQSFEVRFTVNAASAPSAPKGGFTSLAEALAYLDTNTGGSTADNPVALKLNVNQASSTDGWYALVVAIRDSGKYVALDLSGSSVINGEFDSGINNADMVQAKIVSLILPDSATAIIGGSDSLSSGVYAYLKTVSGANITTIGNKAFVACGTLTTVSFPEATSIGDAAFAYCQSLTTVSFPEATSIGNSAFSSCYALTTASFPEATSIGEYTFSVCTALTTVSFPEATSIEDYAFSSCTALTTVSIPKITSIGDYAFSGCTSLTTVSFPKVTSIGGYAFYASGRGLLTITMGAAAPTLVSGNTFEGINGSRNVTVRVPSGASGYTDTWQTAFKGRGNTGYTGTVNYNINLVVEYY